MKKNNKSVIKTADGNNQPVIVQQVTVRPFNRQSLDLTKWKNAATSAEGLLPRRVLLYELYHDITTTDGQVIAVTQKRIDAVTRAQWLFTDKEGNPVDEINQLLDCVGFDDLLTEIINSRFWGYSMVEPTFFKNDNEQNEFSVFSIPKKHMRPDLGIVAKEQTSDEGINIREGIYAKTLMEFGKTNDLGLLLSAAYYAILKRNNISDYAEFIEIFGRGIIDATWDGFDETQRFKLAKAFEEMGGGGVIIRPDGTEMKIHNNTGNANGELQKGFAQLMDTYISIVLLGTTETTNSSATSGYAQSKTHQEQDENKNETDLNYVRRNLNSRFIKILKAAGFDTKDGSFILKKVRKPNKEAFEIHSKMVTDLQIPIDDDFFYEEYGVPKPENYEQLKKEALEAKNADLEKEDSGRTAHTPPNTTRKNNKKPAQLNEDESIKPKGVKLNAGFDENQLRDENGMWTDGNNASTKTLKELEQENRTTAPKIPTKNIFKNDVEVLSPEATRDLDKIIEKGEEKTLEFEKISIKDIVPTQRNVNLDNLKKIKSLSNDKLDTEPILLIKIKGKYYIIDGHHRISMQILNGETTINARTFHAKTKEIALSHRSILKKIIGFFQPAPAVTVGAQNPTCCGDHHTKISLAKFVAVAEFDKIKDGVINRFWNAQGLFDSELFDYTAKTLTNGFMQGWRNQPVKLVDLGFEYGANDPALLTSYEMNLFRFAGVKTLYDAQRLNELFRKSKSFKEFYDTASSMLEVHNRTWLETEYNTANAAGESAATYARLMKQTDIFPYWIYKTIGDEKVRHSHEQLNGLVLRFDHPAWNYLMPPNDWNCRCYISPYMAGDVPEQLLKDSEIKWQGYRNSDAFKKSVKGGWGINRGDKALVFTENQHYTSDYLEAEFKMAKINFEQYGLKVASEIAAKQQDELMPKFDVKEKNEAIADFFSEIEKVNSKKYALADFNNRQVLISKATVRGHTNDKLDKYAGRHLLLNEIKNVLKVPDEIWLNNHNIGIMNNYVYIKYYNGEALAVIAQLKKDLTLEIESWFILDREDLRRGLLILNNKAK